MGAIIPKLILLLLGSIFIAVGGGIAYFTWVSGSWPTASAVVTESKVVGGGKAKAAVSYDFQLGDHHYQGNTVSYDDYSSSDISHAQSIVDEYPVGKTIQIHYNPASPQSSVIRGGSIGFFPLIFLSIGLLLVAWPVFAILKDLLILAIACFC